MKILLLDVETSPNLVTVWGLWNQNVSINQILESGYTLCWSAKWYGEKELMFDSIYQSSPKKMIKNIYKLLNEADAVVHFNGSKFDIPTLNKEFILFGLTPPAPYKQIDLLRTARAQFKFPSNKLDYIAQALSLGKKTKHIGHELWLRCMNKEPEAWKMMEEYNKQDVVLLEAVYNKLKPWIKGHANHGLYGDSAVCPACGSAHYHRRGVAYTSICTYQRYQCQECGHWFRSNKAEKKDGEKFTSIK